MKLLPIKAIQRHIYFIRDRKVMLDSDLAELYGVPTKALNQAIRRNRSRFPSDFMFQLTPHEMRFLRSQFVTSNIGRGGRRYSAYAFTEQGVSMLSSVLKSERAVQVNIVIMRVFVKVRELLATHKELVQKLENLERKYDGQFKAVFDAIRKLMKSPETSRQPAQKPSPIPRVRGFVARTK